MKIKGFANYGCLVHEKVVVFTHSAPAETATVSDEIEITIPEDWEVAENIAGEIILTAPWGWTYYPDQVLFGKSNPCLYAIDANGKTYNRKLEWEEK